MKKEQVPQDVGPLRNISREVVYAKNAEGKFEKTLSVGWNVKKEALDIAWQEVNEKIEKARMLVLAGKRSPIHFYMEKNLMDIKVLTGYSGFNKFSVFRHLRARGFSKLPDAKLQVYALIFDVGINQLKNFDSTQHGI